MELLKHKTKNLEFTYYLKDGKQIRHGLSKSWHSNGQLGYKCNYKDGERCGLHRAWYENGQLEFEGTFKNETLQGLCRRWYKNGQPEFEENYNKDGGYHGRQQYWPQKKEKYERYIWNGLQYESKEEWEDLLIANKSW